MEQIDAAHLGWTLIVLAILIGAAAQSATGFGAGLVTLPALAAFAPQYVPAGLILLSIPLTVSNVVFDRRHIDAKAVATLSLSRIVGMGGGVFLLTVMSTRSLQVMCLVASVLALLTLAEHKILDWMAWWPVAGTVSGFMGSVAGVGGPALASALRKLPIATTRGTAGAVMTIGAGLTLATLAVAGEFTLDDIVFALAMAPLLIVGTIGGRKLFLTHSEARSRQAIVAIVALGCVVLALQVIW